MTRRSAGWKEIEKMRAWLNKNGIQNPRDQGREWFRSSFSVSFDIWDELVLKKWFKPDEKEKEEDE